MIIKPGNPLTNAQIDMLVPNWEKSEKSNAAAAAAAKNVAASTDKAAIGESAGKPRLRKFRNWEDDNGDAVKTTKSSSSAAAHSFDADVIVLGKKLPLEEGALPRGVYGKMRSSLDEALSEVSEQEGMSDEEYQRRLVQLQTVSDTLPREVSDHLK